MFCLIIFFLFCLIIFFFCLPFAFVSFLCFFVICILGLVVMLLGRTPEEQKWSKGWKTAKREVKEQEPQEQHG